MTRDASGRGAGARGMAPDPLAGEVVVRPTTEADFEAIGELCRLVYPGHPPYGRPELESHLALFPEGQLTAVERGGDGDGGAGEERVVGMAASLVVTWDDYDVDLHWYDFTADGFFTNHDPTGRTLYGAEVMVHPRYQGRGVGSRLYEARDELLSRLGLARIRAGARLRGYHAYAGHMAAREYVDRVVAGEIRDPTLSFQLNRGFHVLAVVSGYFPNDPESLGWAAVIEKLNPESSPATD